MLSHRSQVAQMRRVAVQALESYPLADPELRFIAHGENTTFRVDATAPDGRDRFLLRVHRPARHGRNAGQGAASGEPACAGPRGGPLPAPTGLPEGFGQPH
jgi:hypothetical protein